MLGLDSAIPWTARHSKLSEPEEPASTKLVYLQGGP
jgi:hypothetical protein